MNEKDIEKFRMVFGDPHVEDGKMTWNIPTNLPGNASAPSDGPSSNVNHPVRYTKGGVECIDALESAVAGKPPDEAVSVANVIKYLWRYEEKEPVRSLESAEWYLRRLIRKVKENPSYAGMG